MTSSIDSHRARSSSRSGAWAGWIMFGALTLIVSGAFTIIWAIVAIVRDHVFLTGPNGNVINLDYSTWGWIHLVVGILAVLSGIYLFKGSFWARIIAIILAMLSAIANLLVISAYPVWSVVVISFDVLVIYAITVHGSEMADQ